MKTTVESGDVSVHEHRVARMLGVAKIFKGGLGSAVAVHEALHAGLPRRALFRAIPAGIPVPRLLPVFGISVRTFMRLKAEPDKLLDAEQSGRPEAHDALSVERLQASLHLSPPLALCRPCHHRSMRRPPRSRRQR